MISLKPRVFEHGVVFLNIDKLYLNRIVCKVHCENKITKVDYPFMGQLTDDKIDYICECCLNYVLSNSI